MVKSDNTQEQPPILVRLSFRVPSGKTAEFEVAYREQLLPILNQRGLTESPERGRAGA